MLHPREDDKYVQNVVDMVEELVVGGIILY
jgi:hypothetical protein